MAVSVQMWVLIFSWLESSRLPARTTVKPGSGFRWEKSGEPQFGQKCRLSVRPLSVAESSYFLVVPCVTLNWALGTTTLTVPWAPEDLRQFLQWHARRSETGAAMV